MSVSEVISPSDEAPMSIYDFLVSQTARHPAAGGLSEAALRGWIRLEIFCAVMRQETLDVRLDDLGFDRALSPTDDDTWAWRMVLHSMDVVRYCFGTGGRSVAAYDKLAAYATRWMGAVPESFQPVFVRNPLAGDDEVFPEILLLSDAVVVGMQHFHLNRLLLTAHNPNIPRLGKNQKLATLAMDVSYSPLPTSMRSNPPVCAERTCHRLTEGDRKRHQDTVRNSRIDRSKQPGTHVSAIKPRPYLSILLRVVC